MTSIFRIAAAIALNRRDLSRTLGHYGLLIALITICAIECFGDDVEPTAQVERIEKAITAGTRFLVDQQSPDGTWRSQAYGLLKDGTSLTPLVLFSLPKSTDCQAARERGMGQLTAWVDRQSLRPGIKFVPQYPVYTSSLCLSLSAPGQMTPDSAPLVAWRELLVSFQLQEANGWSASDQRYGGWGYSHERPVKPDEGAPVSPLDEPNLSATVFALEALTASDPKGERSSSAKHRALEFVKRCQNWNDEGPANKFNDGGFHFMLKDEVRNKAGIAGVDDGHETRFLSYGSATADGLRALLLCGLRKDNPRVLAAQRWLIKNFGDGEHPGAYPQDRKHLQSSLDFYYAASVATALSRMDDVRDLDWGGRNWAALLSARLIASQREDGSWSNPAVDVREDDPLVATPLALISLRWCAATLKHSSGK